MRAKGKLPRWVSAAVLSSLSFFLSSHSWSLSLSLSHFYFNSFLSGLSLFLYQSSFSPASRPTLSLSFSPFPTVVLSFILPFFFSSLSRRQWRNLVWWGGLARRNMITTIAVTTLPELTQPEPDHLSQMGPGTVDPDGYTQCSMFRRAPAIRPSVSIDTRSHGII